MVSQRPSLLIDTNVWLDYFLPDRAGGKEAIDSSYSLSSTNSLFFTPLPS